MEKIVFGEYYELMLKTKWTNVITLNFISQCFRKLVKKNIIIDTKYIDDIININNKIKFYNGKRKILNNKKEPLEKELYEKQYYLNIIGSLLLMCFPTFILFIASVIYTFLSQTVVGAILTIIFFAILMLSLLGIYIYYYHHIYKYEFKVKKINEKINELSNELQKVYDEDLNLLIKNIYENEIKPLMINNN